MYLPFKNRLVRQQVYSWEQQKCNPQNRLAQYEQQRAMQLGIWLSCHFPQRSSFKAAGVANAASLPFTAPVKRRGWLESTLQT